MSMYITSLMRVLIGVFILMFGFWRLWLIFLRLRYSGLFIIAVHNCVRNVLAIFILNGVNHLTWFFLICFFFLKPKKFFVCMLSCDIWYYLIMILVFCSVLGYFEAQEWNFGVKFRNSKVFSCLLFRFVIERVWPEFTA